jgi:hypothetical protein
MRCSVQMMMKGGKLLSLFKKKSFVWWQVYDGSSNGLYLFGECLFRLR